MDSDQRFYCSMTAIITFALCVLIIGGMTAYNQRMKYMLQNGYEEVTVMGHSETVWQKVRK